MADLNQAAADALARSFGVQAYTDYRGLLARGDIDALITSLQEPFGKAEETAADDMDQATYFALIELHASLTNHLVTTGRPLPQRIPYQFAVVLPSLVLAYRLYADASRADEIRAENKIVHPAFCPPIGLALSA